MRRKAHYGQQALSNIDYLDAAKIIKRGGVVAFPTETSYGLAVDISSYKGLTRLFQLKQRSNQKAIPVLVGSKKQLLELVIEIPDQYVPLIKKFWPGPLTLLFNSKEHVSDILTGGQNKIGVRISSNPVAQKLIEIAAMPITATSANISGEPPAMVAEEVDRQLGEKVDLILEDDTGVLGGCSTILTIENDQLKLVRSGVIPFEQILRYSL